jgi:predicted ATPase/signal transduction histidine kinase/DNA-binding response OmpR family regulator
MLDLRPGPLSATGESTVVRSTPRGPRDEEHRRRLERERVMAASLGAVPCVLAPLRYEETADALVLTFTDPGTRPLSTLPRPLGRELGRFLNFAIALTEAVGALHAAKVMHLGLCPDAIRLGTTETDVHLAGLSEASRLRTEAADAQGALARPERLPYLAPEQTGRMNRPVDRRADLYALGVLLYEVATGALPFEAADALGWVHAHLARRPTPPGRALPGLPEAISAVLLRLLSKDVDERYRSTVGLLADLRALAKAWAVDGQIGDFEPGRRDVADVLQIPERLYGRQREFELLEARFARAATAQPTALWVRGEPGIGKTRLIGDLNRPVAAAGGLFAVGKADQFRRNLPFDAPVQAFRGLLRQVLAWPDARLDTLRAAMDAGLGPNVAVLTEVMPELARLLPERPPAPTLGGPEAELRFRLTFQRFVEVFATPEHPLFLFLDDLQWVDPASLALVESLLNAGHGPCALCLVGSWRDTEVGPTHPLTEMLARLDAAGLEAPTLTLGPLSPEALQALVADALGGPRTGPGPETLTALTRIVVEKTGANPFFAGRFLQRIAEDGFIEFDPGTFRFRVELEAIGRAALADNVAAHLARDFGRLSPGARALLPCAAALGARFCVEELAVALARPAPEIVDALHDAADLGFVERTGAERGGEFRFVHDHLQTAVYGRLDPGARAALHLSLARALRGTTAPEALGEVVFTVAHHYEQAGPQLDTPILAVEAATVLWAAGLRAQAAGAPEAAVRFLRAGLALLGDTPFEADAMLATELHIALAQAERAHRNAEEALRLCDVIDAHPGRAWDRVRTAELRVYLLNNLMRLNEAADQALALVASLGHPITPALSMDDVIANLGRIEVARADRPPATLSRLPELDDPEAAAVCRILATLLPTLAMAVPHMHVPAVATVLEIALTRGVTPDTAYATGHWGIIMAAAGQYPYAYAIGQLTDALRERFSDRPTIAGLVEVPMMTQHLAEPIRDCARTLHWGARRSLELGNPTGYGYCGNQAICFEMMAGTPLPVFDQTWRRVRALVVEHQQYLALPPVDTWGQLASSFRGDYTGDVCDMVGPRFDFNASVPEFQRIGVVTSVLYAVNSVIWLCTVFNQPARALACAATYAAELAAPINLPAFGQVVLRFHVMLARLDTGEGLETAFPAELAALRTIATQVPANHGHRLALIEAELALRRGDFVSAGAGFESAFAQARAERFLHDAALIAERAARAAERMNGTVLVRAWRREAIEAYDAWGATEKSVRLRREWPDALPAAESAPERSAGRTLDLDAALRAAETIAGEMDLERLLSRAMRLMCAAAGAERGALLLDRDGVLQVEAVAEGEDVEVQNETRRPVEGAASPEIVQYVARAQEALLLSDAAADPRFAGTAYVATRAPRSVLCTPLMHRGRRTGVLYLENGLTTGAFTADRVEVLRLLAFQAATAIENAMLYAAARARAEELREKNEALSAVDRIKDELLARTSHELRTPLHGIIGLAQTVLDAADPLDAASRRSLDMIVSSGRRLGNLINDILDFQTLKRRDITLSRGAVSVHDATTAVLTLCEPLLAGRPVRLVNAVPSSEGADPVVFADPDRLAQILLNLVGNACKFTERGVITVDAAVEPVNEPGRAFDGEHDRVATIRVRDTGIGIAPDVIARIFEGFEQGDASIARRYGGAGLGLTVARQLVELHGGTIRVESAVGEGSVFAFTLPIARQTERRQRPTDEVRERVSSPIKTSRPTDIVAVTDEGRGRRVLVVDDEPVNVQVVLAQLGRAGYEVATALDGPTALEMLAQGLRPDAVLLDVMMPRMDGYEVCTRLRDRFPRHALPVVMLTARNQVDDLVQGLTAGANDYVTKPFTGQELLARLRTHLALSQVNAAIGQFVPYPFLQLLGRESITDVRLGDSVARPMSVLFANMRAFTRLTEQMNTAETFRFINEYLGLLAPAVARHGGFVDKYIGDAIMAIFDGGADAAVRAGLEMNLVLLDLNARRTRAGQSPIRIGVGVNTGELVLGTVGTDQRMDTTVISEAVNVAARMQTLTRRYDTQLLVTERTMAALAAPDAYAHRILDQVTLPGRTEALPVFEIYASDPEDVRAAKDATRPTFEQAVRAFHGRALPEAIRLFTLCRALNPQDRVVDLYLDRCQKIQRQFTGDAWGGEI